MRHADELSALPGLSSAGVKEAASRLVTVRDVVDATRVLASGALDLYVASTSNRLSPFAERLTILATVVVPLVVSTGFFGQNFGWLVTRVDGLAAFLVFGWADRLRSSPAAYFCCVDTGMCEQGRKNTTPGDAKRVWANREMSRFSGC